MNLNPVTPLYTKAVTVTAIHLWYHHELYKLAEITDESYYKEVKDLIEEDMEDLPLSEKHADDVLSMIEPLGRNYKSFVKSLDKMRLPVALLSSGDLQNIVWDSVGMIDCQGTISNWVEVLSRSSKDVGDILTSFLAIPDFHCECASRDDLCESCGDINTQTLVKYVKWGWHRNAESILERLRFKKSAVAQSVIRLLTGRAHFNPRFLILCLTYLDESDREDILVSYAKEVFHWMVKCPVFVFFLPVNDTYNNLLPDDEFEDVVTFLAGEVEEKASYSLEFFRDFWDESVVSQKEFIVSRLLYGSFVEDWFNSCNPPELYLEFCETNFKEFLLGNATAVMYLLNIVESENESRKSEWFKQYLLEFFDEEVLLNTFNIP